MTNLRSSALEFLTSCGVFDVDAITVKNVHFTNTLDKKIEKIKLLGCEIFIDDLDRVFEHPKFPVNCHKILFNSTSKKFGAPLGWKEICNDLFG